MPKLSTLVVFALLRSGARARADSEPSSVTDTCEHDPKCYARDLALTLTSTPPSLVLPRWSTS